MAERKVRIYEQPQKISYALGNKIIAKSEESMTVADPDISSDLTPRIRPSKLIDNNGNDRTAVCCLSSLNIETYDEWKDELDFNLIAVSVDDSRSIRRAKALVNGKAWPYEIYLDTNQDFKRSLGTSFIPQTLIVKNGKILYQHTGYQPGDEDYLFEKLNTYADSN